ncbi:SgcJ/EcaC family oxidoreductase [Micromonospora sp. KC606]|uniref:SgcJ/EcaC family oxidoreductase n=1 Tax=Micromonospora sp. KC606 TaxID=2530379 RepID=UPI001A9E223C|nr:SgcJ/EcaC family oxidoreductase [Micromonospora sp. KC606]
MSGTGLFTEWNAALTTGDPDVVADRYADDAVLLPTLSNQVRTNRAQIVDYFEHFLENNPQGEIKQSHINILDKNTAIDTGVYVFTLAATGQQVEARYTYVYELRDGRWLIVNHHSSAMPESTNS